MAASPNRQLWDPRRGIVFARSEPSVLYPQIDFSRHVHVSAPGVTRASSEPPTLPSSQEEPRSGARQAGPAADDCRPAPAQHKSYSGVATPTIQTDRSVEISAGATGSADADTATDAAAEVEPPYTDLEYKVSAAAFHDARKAAAGSPESFWSYTMYRGPEEDGVPKKVKVHYCKSKHTMERVCQYFLGEDILGFDMEWVAEANKYKGVRKNVSLIQMASPSRIALFHIALFPKTDGDFVAPTFRAIMEDPEVSKAGVAIKADCTRLRNFLGVATRGIFELSHLYRLVKYSSSGQVELVNKRLVPLATQVQEYLHLPMFKGQDVRSSDWTQPLSMDQIVYAASDAYSGIQLFHLMEERRKELDPCPPRPYHAELGLPIRLADGVSISTADENSEAVEPGCETSTNAALSASFFATVKETIQVEVDAESESILIVKTKTTAKTTKSRAKDPRVAAADGWLADYRACKPVVRAAPSAIRAYRIWHTNADANPQEVARLLREPPLQTNTVVGYILETLRLEKLPFDKPRLRDEVLALVPKEVRTSRYKMLTNLVEASGNGKPAGSGSDQAAST